MIQQHQAQIYKSDFREVTVSEHFKRLATIDSVVNHDISNKPFETLLLLSEEILAPKAIVKALIESNTDVVLLPLFGGIEYKDSFGNEDFIRVEQIRHIVAKKGMAFELYNPYGQNVSCLQLWLNAKAQHPKNNFSQVDFDLSQKNQLIPLFETSNTFGLIGTYDGRKEGLYTLRDASNGVFVFVIHGAFEVENRLLEARDGLRIEQIETIEWEALSENALLMVLEITSDK